MDLSAKYSAAAGRLRPSIIRALLKLVQNGDVISLAGGTPDAALFDRQLFSELAARVTLDQGRLALQYGETQGWLPLREQIVAYLAGRGMRITPEQVLITTGSQQGIDLLARLFLDPGDQVAMEAPGYLGALIAFHSYGATALSLPLRDGGVDPAEVDQALAANPQVKLLYLTPSFQNPSGACLSPTRRQAILQVATKHGVLLVEDDPYGEISFDGPAPRPICADDTQGAGVFLGSFSKMAVPGLRVGWVAGPADLIAKLSLAKESVDVCSSTLTQAIGAEYLKGGHLQTTLPRLRKAYRSRRDVLHQAASAAFPKGSKLALPNGGFFLWAELPMGCDAQALFDQAVAEGVAYVPGAVFFSDPSQGRNTLRLSYCAVDEAALALGAERLGKVLSSVASR